MNSEPEFPNIDDYSKNGTQLGIKRYPGGQGEFDGYFERKHTMAIISIKDVVWKSSDWPMAANKVSIAQCSSASTTPSKIGDPLLNFKKELIIEYKDYKDDEHYIKRRRIREDNTLDFGWDIISARWGPNLNAWILLLQTSIQRHS